MNKIKRTLLLACVLAAVFAGGCTESQNPQTKMPDAEEQTAAEPSLPEAGAGEAERSDGENGTEEAGPSLPEAGTREAVSSGELLTVTFLDVGQGNAVLVENEGSYMLIDGGDRDYSSYVVSYLRSRGVEELEYVISSHYDADHLNGVVGALHAFPCSKLLAADYTTDTKVYQSLLTAVEEQNIEVEYPDMGETYAFGDAEFTVVCPDAYDYTDDNDNSIGIRLVYGENSFLICGDAGTEVERMMLQSGLTVASDVYLASHHGSAGSSSQEFLEAVEPKAVVISAGFGNSYGHPTEAVLGRISQLSAELYRTDLQGEITVVSDGSNLTWNVEPCTDFRSGEELSAGSEQKQSNVAAPEQGVRQAYILNMNTKKFHYPSCSSVSEMKEKNKAEFTGTREEAMAAGYEPCGRCRP